MKVELLVGSLIDPEEDVVFDSRDYNGEAISKEEIIFDIENAVQLLARSSARKGIFVLFEPAGGMSIPDLFRKIRTEAKGLDSIHIRIKSEDVREYLISRLPPAENLSEHFSFKGKTLSVITADIVEVMADAIVNASNTQLILGSGVSGAIREKAGPRLQEEMTFIGKNSPLRPGGVVLTDAYDLNTCRYIIHAATANGAKSSVERAVTNIMEICGKNNIIFVAIPALGTGTGGLPMSQCAGITTERIMTYWENSGPDADPKAVILVLVTESDFNEFAEKVRSHIQFQTA